ncbi:unnamed protein product [Cylindrotheca closterium]|uniref:Uncharacterized protein n=1 Tax=Cylindrotheca closterium TaxID=2856 RepID=A0AAD2FGS0_9STRA|nr:unnamed protein product [Cylindrotheca closterium]
MISEISFNSLCIQEGLQEEFGTSIVEHKDSSSSVTTVLETLPSFESMDTLEAMPKKGILKATSCIPPSAIETHIHVWVQQPIPGSLPSTTSRRQRRRGHGETTFNRYDRVKTTRFPLLEDDRDRRRHKMKQERVRKQHPKKTVDEQWVLTCKFLW